MLGAFALVRFPLVHFHHPRNYRSSLASSGIIICIKPRSRNLLLLGYLTLFTMGLNHSSEAQSLPHPELQIQRQRLRAILQAIPLFGSGIVKPPIIDASIDSSGDEEKQSQDSVYGLRSLRDAVRRDLDVLEKVSNSPLIGPACWLSKGIHYYIMLIRIYLVVSQ